MSTFSLENIPLGQIIQVALRYHQSGQFAEAEKLYTQVLEADPDHFDALHLSGVLAYQSGKFEAALTLISKAVQHKSTSARAIYNLGEVNRMLNRLEDAEECFLDAIKLNPDYTDAWNSLGMVRQKAGNLLEAEVAYHHTLEQMPDSTEAHNNLGSVLHDLGKFEEAEKEYRQALTLKEDYAEAHNNLGTLLKDLEKFAEAEIAFRRSLTLNPEIAEVHNNLGAVLLDLNRPEESVAECRHALQLRQTYADAHANLGAALTTLGQQQEARSAFDLALQYSPDLAEVYNSLGARLHNLGRTVTAKRPYSIAVALKPDFAEAHSNMGILHYELGCFDDAVLSYRQAIAIKPDFVDAYNNLGASLKNLGRLEEAEQTLLQALALDPDSARAYGNLGNIFEQRGCLKEAEKAHRKALALLPDYAEALNNLGIVLQNQGKHYEAVELFEQALAFKPDLAEIHNNLGCSCHAVGRMEDSILHFQRAVELNPDYHSARSNLVYQLQQICHWDARGETHTQILRKTIQDNIKLSTVHIPPFVFFSLPYSTPAEQKNCATAWAASLFGPLSRSRYAEAFSNHSDDLDPVHIGYLSADFNDHVVSRQFIEVLEHHDRQHFRISAYSYSHDDGSILRKRLERSVDSFVDISLATYAEAARTIQEDNIDILVDLTGHTANSRSAILAYRPATIQVNYLGYPGTMGTELVDYLIADNFIIPPEFEEHYVERVFRLPGCYLPNDRTRIRPKTLSRNECGLPDEAIVFCCFNQAYKITPMMFDVWCCLLQTVPDSVLWLRAFNPLVEQNIKHEAENRGIDRNRIIMANSVPATTHLARLACADLFLDTTPYNAHATCSDALWMGVPVVTCAGETFPSRVAGSLLHTMGVPELVTNSLDEYYHVAFKLATEHDTRKKLKENILANCETSPLFDSRFITRGLETIYLQMMKQINQSS